MAAAGGSTVAGGFTVAVAGGSTAAVDSAVAVVVVAGAGRISRLSTTSFSWVTYQTASASIASAITAATRPMSA